MDNEERIIAELADGQSALRLRAAAQYCAPGPLVERAVPALIELTRAREPSLREAGVAALGNVRQPDSLRSAIQAMLALNVFSAVGVQRAVVHAFRGFFSLDEPGLSAVVSDFERAMMAYVRDCLRADLGCGAAVVSVSMPVFAEGLRKNPVHAELLRPLLDADAHPPQTVLNALQVVCFSAPAGALLVDAIAGLLAHKESRLRSWVRAVLEAIGNEEALGACGACPVSGFSAKD